MTKLEQIDKLRERTNVTYDEAKEALEATDWDLLDAIIYLERKGKVAPPPGEGRYSSERPSTRATVSGESNGNSGLDNFMKALEKLGKACVKLINKGNKTIVDVRQHDESKVKFPLTVLVLLLIFFPYVTIPLGIIGLFFGFTYQVSDGNTKDE